MLKQIGEHKNKIAIVVLIIIGIALCSIIFKETFINDYHNNYCPREDSVYVHPPGWWSPERKYNPEDWFVLAPDTLQQKAIWMY